MAQLVKLYDYISRYESNPFHYPSQYIRLKQHNWKTLQHRWEKESAVEMDFEEKKDSSLKKFSWNPFNRLKQKEEGQTEVPNDLPETENQLKQYFLNQLYPIQMKWATSTITQTSFTKISVQDTAVLKYFLQRFPDIYLLMYHPIFNIQNAPMDGEIILIGPFEIEIIRLMNKDPEITMNVTDDRKWTLETGHSQKSIVSPIIALKRTEQIIKSIFRHHEIHIPVKKSIVSENNHILYSSEPYQINIVGKEKYHKWFESKRNLQSTLKNTQLKAMMALLEHCQTSSVRRPEWESEPSDTMPIESEDD